MLYPISEKPRTVYVKNIFGTDMIKQEIIADAWFELGVCKEDGDGIETLSAPTLKDLYYLWQYHKNNTRTNFKYHFYNHELAKNGSDIVDYITQGQVYYMDGKIYFDPVERATLQQIH